MAKFFLNWEVDRSRIQVDPKNVKCVDSGMNRQ